MILLAFALVGGSLAAPDSLPLATAAGAVVVHRQPALPLVTLRLSLVADDPPGYAGAGHLQQHLVFPRLRDHAARVGGEAEILRTSDAVVYSVTGPTAELTYLARVLRSALQLGAVSPGQMLAAQYALAQEREEEWDSAPRAVRARLRAQLFPEAVSAAGTPASAARLDAAGLRAAWAAMYRPERLAVTAVGDVEQRTVQQLFRYLPAPSAGERLAPSADTVAASPGPPEATRGWLGLAFPAGGENPAALTVAARLTEIRLRERFPAATVQAEHWWTHRGQALALVVGVPAADFPAAARELGTALEAVRDATTDADVRKHASAARRDLLFAARTTGQMAGIVGAFTDRTGDPNAAQRYDDALRDVRPAEVRALLGRLAALRPARVEIAPRAVAKP